MNATYLFPIQLSEVHGLLHTFLLWIWVLIRGKQTLFIVDGKFCKSAPIKKVRFSSLTSPMEPDIFCLLCQLPFVVPCCNCHFLLQTIELICYSRHMNSKKGSPPPSLPSKIPYADMSVSQFPLFYMNQEEPAGMEYQAVILWELLNPWNGILPQSHLALILLTCKQLPKPASFCKDWARLLGLSTHFELSLKNETVPSPGLAVLFLI